MTIESNALELPQSKTNAASHGLAKTGEQKLFRSFFARKSILDEGARARSQAVHAVRQESGDNRRNSM